MTRAVRCQRMSSMTAMGWTSEVFLPTRQSMSFGILRNTGDSKQPLQRTVQMLINPWISQLSSCFLGKIALLSLVSILNRKRGNMSLNYKYVLFIFFIWESEGSVGYKTASIPLIYTSCKISFARKWLSPSSTLGLLIDVARPKSPEKERNRAP